ncbi:lysine N(6)-hydroxylase/L-ornithine N(5)-oxygenase family protein, partial [Phytoactinopolyspora endophytica]|uniref:lysine N(6)-hydroxylase/L-ornithine N(5)-oxygenase family protein n=1 Tax=Phytoactinopolyspora endophytica TaxID=1642495 RepID=UPI00197B9624
MRPNHPSAGTSPAGERSHPTSAPVPHPEADGPNTAPEVGRTFDVIGVGLGPFNLGLAALLDPVRDIDALFFEAEPVFAWHPGLMLPGTTLQVPFMADLVTLADPTSRYSFLNYLQEHNRLYRFYFYERFHIPRREYDAYARWVAGSLPSCRFGHRVDEVTPNDDGTWSVRVVRPAPPREGEFPGHEVSRRVSSSPQTRHGTSGGLGETVTYRARSVVFGVGSRPWVPQVARDVLGDDVYHAADYLPLRDKTVEAGAVTVVGSGQSAGEIVADLLEARLSGRRSGTFMSGQAFALGDEHASEWRDEHVPGRAGGHTPEWPDGHTPGWADGQVDGETLDWFTRGAGFLPMEYSKLGLEHFTPEYTNHFHSLPPQTRDRIRAGQDLLYKGLSAETSERIYDLLYEATIERDDPPVTYAAGCELEAIEPSPVPGRRWRLTWRHRAEGRTFTRDTDVVVLATGYEPAPVPVPEGFVVTDEHGCPAVSQDYRLRLADEPPSAEPTDEATASGGASCHRPHAMADDEPRPDRHGGASSLFVQNAELHTHGVGAPDLGLGAYRNSVIINAVAGREVYPVRDRTVFQ